MSQKTDSIPKCMVEIWGKPIIEWQKKILKATGSVEIGIVLGYKKELVNTEELTVFVNSNWDSSNVLSSFLCAREWLVDDDVLIIYSDILYSSNLIKEVISNEADFVIPSYQNFKELWIERFINPLEDLESFKVDSLSNVYEIGRKENNIENIQGQFMGIVFVKNKSLRRILKIVDNMTTQEKMNHDMTSFIQVLINNSVSVTTFQSNSFWIEIDSANDLKLYENKYDISNINEVLNLREF